MKKSIKKAVILCLAILFVLASVNTAFAETIYSYNGYLYTYISNSMVSLYGLEESTDYLIFPDVLNSRNVVDVRNNAFKDNTEITGIYFSPGCNLMRIGSFTFKGCTALDGTLKLPPTLETMETAAFQECTSLDGVVIDIAGSEISNQAFYKCSSLSDVTIGTSITSIGDYAFADCTSLSYVEIPSGVTSIADTAFLNDSDITLGVYYNSAAYLYAQNNGIAFTVLDPESVPTEPATEPETEATTPVTEATEATEPPTTPVEVSFILGDADNSGNVDIVDATFAQRYVTRSEIPAEILSGMDLRADIDSSGEVESTDVTFIMRHIIRLNVPYPIGELITV